MIDIKLYTLLEVLETGSYSSAARNLSLTQPAVSQHIKRLERELGIKVFNRHGNTIKSTPEGDLVIKYARRNIALYQKMKEDILNQGREIKKLSVGITHTAESNAVAEVLGKYSANHPGTQISIVADSINNLYDMLRSYELDLIVVEGKAPSRGINSLLLDTDSLVLALSNDHHLAKKNMVSLDDVRKEALILRRHASATRELFVSHLSNLDLTLDDFRVIMEVDSVAIIKNLVKRSIGVSILPRSVCLNELQRGEMRILPIENLSLVREINILYHEDFGHSYLLDSIMKEYRQTVKNYLK